MPTMDSHGRSAAGSSAFQVQVRGHDAPTCSDPRRHHRIAPACRPADRRAVEARHRAVAGRPHARSRALSGAAQDRRLRRAARACRLSQGAARSACSIDATHPFATQMSRHAAIAAAETKVPFFALCRPAWQQGRRRSLDRRGFGCRGGRQARQEAAPGVRDARPAGDRRRSATRRITPISCAASIPSIRRSTFPMPATSSTAARSPLPPSALCCPKKRSTSCSPRTAAATPPTPRSRRRATSASRSCWCAGRRPTASRRSASVPEAVQLAAHRLPPVEKRGV